MENTDTVLVDINSNQVPLIIREQFNGLKALKDNVIEATKKAESAKKTAQAAKETSAGLFQKKEAIELLQSATVALADAQVYAAQAQEVSFEYQRKIAEIIKYLFALGVSNIATNRSVVRELELKLKGASTEELDELARQEIIAVVEQLKAQEDIMKKQGDLSKKVKANEITLRTHEQKSSEYERRLKEHIEKDKEYAKMVTLNKKKIIEHDKTLTEKIEKDKNQDEEIACLKKLDSELSKLFNQLLVSNLENQNQIMELQIACEKLTKSISENATIVENNKIRFDEKISKKASNRLVVVSYFIGVAGVIAAVIQFFI